LMPQVSWLLLLICAIQQHWWHFFCQSVHGFTFTDLGRLSFIFTVYPDKRRF